MFLIQGMYKQIMWGMFHTSDMQGLYKRIHYNYNYLFTLLITIMQYQCAHNDVRALL